MSRLICFILVALLAKTTTASIKVFASDDHSIRIINDTVYYNKTPLCLVKRKDSVTTISTFYHYDIITLTTFDNDNGKYYAVNFLPMSAVHYAKFSKNFLPVLLERMALSRVIDDNYFSYSGANKLITGLRNQQLLIDGNGNHNAHKDVLNWQIGWRNTDNPDSMLMLADKKPFAYYKYRHWKEYGVESFDRLQRTGELYAYFLYDFDNKPLATISVILSNDASTLVKVTTHDKKEYYFKNVPKERHILLVAAKLILAQQVLDHK